MASHPYIHLESKQKTTKDAPVDNQSYKYRNYWNFRKPVSRVRSFEYLAMCRAEDLKFVTVRLDLPEQLRHRFTDFCLRRFLSR